MSKTNILRLVRNVSVVSDAEQNVFENSMEMLACKKMYTIMFNAATDAIEKIHDAGAILYKAQQNCEKIFMEATDTEDFVLMGRTGK